MTGNDRRATMSFGRDHNGRPAVSFNLSVLQFFIGALALCITLGATAIGAATWVGKAQMREMWRAEQKPEVSGMIGSAIETEGAKATLDHAAEHRAMTAEMSRLSSRVSEFCSIVESHNEIIGKLLDAYIGQHGEPDGG